MSEPVVITDSDQCIVSEGRELQLQGRGFVPYPATPPPRDSPVTTDTPEG